MRLSAVFIDAGYICIAGERRPFFCRRIGRSLFERDIRAHISSMRSSVGRSMLRSV
nr:MAG TPA: hypothetical protein [Caudoviricetes sp.]